MKTYFFTYTKVGRKVYRYLYLVIIFLIVDAKITAGGTHVLSVLWNNEREEQYPAVWLRDNCQCSECYQASALGRLHLMKNVETDINFEKLTIKNNVVNLI